MWDLGSRNRSIVVLLSALSVSLILYNAWGPLLFLLVSIIAVIYVIYSLLTNDSILSPHAFYILEYLREFGEEFTTNLYFASANLSTKLREFLVYVKTYYQVRLATEMNRFRRNTYQLSDETRNLSKTSRFDLMSNQISPIPRNDVYRSRTFDPGLENASYTRRVNAGFSPRKQTSTPINPWAKETNVVEQQGIGLFTPNRQSRQDTESVYRHGRQNEKNDNYSPNSSSWGTSVSPKIPTDTPGIRAVQTVAGPLLASTRYNIDPKIYLDVTSPGLSSRLARYASEANNKLGYQPQYATGQFPKVNLHAAPLPLINAKSSKCRTPVTVRIAPPQKGCEKRFSRNETKATPSVLQVLREISLKRHASREHINSELIKKQRTDGVFDEESLDELEEMTQKRTREDSPSTDDESSSKNEQSRPVKKTKTPSCYDVINSLSSSCTSFPSGIKRKASTLDISRSGTPDAEKHFKLSDVGQPISTVPLETSESPTLVVKSQSHDSNITHSAVANVAESSKVAQEQVSTRAKGILKSTPNSDPVTNQEKSPSVGKKIVEASSRKSTVVNEPSNYTDKLFMKAEPRTNERLRTLIQEQGNIRAKFTSDDVDEIKKEDIVKMRKTSMRARLQSMFDAISGKAVDKINPDVVIHAEGVNETATPAIVTPDSPATLNSTTSTTNVNTSPISTSAVARVGTNDQTATTKAKHVTFNLPSYQSSNGSSNSSIITATATDPKTSSVVDGNSTQVSKSFSTPSSVTSSAPATTKSSDTSDSVGSLNPITGVFTSIAATPTAQTNVSVSSKPDVSTPPSSKSTQSLSSAPGCNTSTVSNNTTPSSQSSTSVQSSTSFGTASVTSSFDRKTVNPELQKQPVPNFSFGTAPTTVANTFSSFGQTASVADDKKASSSISIGNNSGTALSGFGKLIPTSSQPPTVSYSSFNSGTNTAATQSTNAAASSFAMASNKNTPVFTSSTTQNPPPTFGSTPSSQSQATLSQNVSTAGIANPPLFNATTTTAQNPSSLGSVATSNPTTSLSNATVTGSLFAFGKSAAADTSVASGFGKTTTATATTAAMPAPAFSFGSKSPATTATFAFGSNATSTTSTATPINNQFGTSSSNAATPLFGTSTTGTSSFGISATTTASIFGQAPAATTSVFTAPSTTATSIFGAPPTTAPPAFGIPSTTAASMFGTTPTAAPPAFGTPSTTAPPAFGTPSTTAPPAFGTPSTTGTSLFGASTTTTSTIFGTNANQPTFPGTTSFGVSKTTAPPAFGSNTTTPAFGGTNSTSTNLFGGANVNAASKTTTQPSAPLAFGENAPNKNIFGQGTQSTPSFGSSPSTFGGNATPAFGTQSTPSFGTSNAVAGANNSSFGPSNAPASIFGTPNTSKTTTAPPPFGATNPTFGTPTTAPPAFGSNTSTSTAFGSLGSTFGAQNATSPSFGAQNATSPSFGAQNATSPSFGAQNASTTSNFGANAGVLFGAQNPSATPAFSTQSTNPPAFGATSNSGNNNNNNASFSFGGTQPQAQGSTFPFGATAAPNTNTAATPFQFGNTAPKTDSGFNFNAAATTSTMNFGSTTAPSFGAPVPGTNMFSTGSPAVPAGGMFSIGAGSTAPRSRSTRTRKQR